MTTPSRTRLLASGALLAALSFSLVAAAKLSKAGPAGAGFHANGPAGMSIDGTSDEVAIADDGTTISVKVGLTNLKTGIGLRDKHTKAALETDKFPDAELDVARSALKFPAAGGDSSGDAAGTLRLHGQTRGVTFHYTAKYDGDTLNVKGSAHVALGDFGVTPPSYLGISVKPDIDVSATFQAKDN